MTIEAYTDWRGIALKHEARIKELEAANETMRLAFREIEGCAANENCHRPWWLEHIVQICAAYTSEEVEVDGTDIDTMIFSPSLDEILDEIEKFGAWTMGQCVSLSGQDLGGEQFKAWLAFRHDETDSYGATPVEAAAELLCKLYELKAKELSDATR